MRIDGFIWLGAFLISISLHGLLFYRAENIVGVDEREQAARSQSTRVSFRAQSAPPAAKPPAPVPEPEPAPQPEPLEKSPPVAQAEPEPPSAEPREAAVEPMPEPESESAEVVNEAEAEALRAQARRHYLAVLMAHIEAHKHYPRSARRRAIEGKVTVRFQLLDGGQVGGLVVEGGHRLLRGAARDAVEAARPLPAPPEDVALPLPVEFAIRFQLH